MDEEIEVPSYFVCPISMQIMRDPVTVCTGFTYERESIERWMYELQKNTCPATMQVLDNRDLTPNHTLRRLIQQWCIAISSAGVPRIATPDPPLDSNHLKKLLGEIEACPPPPFLVKVLKKLRSLAEKNEGNRRCIALSEAPAVLISLIESQFTESDETYDVAVACEEALGVLHALHLPDDTVETLATASCLASLGSILKRGTCNGRLHAAVLLQKVSTKSVKRIVMNGNDDLIEGLLELVTEEVCHKATVAALQVLTTMSINSRRSRMKAIEAGAVSILIETLPEQTSETKSTCEWMLCLLDVLCRCAEGRVAMVDHAMGIPVISKKIFRVSQSATEKAVRILWSLCQFCPSERILKEMLHVDAVTKLCMLLQVDCTPKTKCKAMEMLKLHGNCWRNSSCVPSRMYPLKL
ncbi:hypothetical protein SUGI_1198170 [Cryptomeria japonica]|uniref:E3 ubiquitin-protein ligase PUB22-like n=1 Tax=Cryptomeria japonica TaxID=3369 RepID=UPI00241490F4|nr:E3 ubiquitin-protein ligase PUB22-like [Cryptomeria japonica]GLJ55803.1 hypothetical protein SUGI_1198170 [Cryptomeria japonica]